MRRYYQILGVSHNATPEQIKEAYIFSLKAFHPDKFAGSSEEQQKIAHERTRAINEAYGILSDPIKRANYHREYMREFGAQPPGAPPPPQTRTQSSKRAESWNMFVANYLLPRGRIGRASFIVRSAVIFAAMTALVLFLGNKSEAEALLGVVGSFLFVGLFAIQAGKRLHDVNAPAGWIFAGITGLGLLVLSILLPCSPGTKGPNRFGPQVAPTKNIKIAALAICLFTLLLGIGSVIITESNKSQTGSSGRLTSSSPNKIAPTQFASVSPTPSQTSNYPGLQLNTPKFDLTQPIPRQVQTVEGTEINYSVAVPNDWIVKRKQELSKEQGDFDLIASHKTVYVGVLAEEANLGDVDTVVDFSRNLLTQRGTDARLSNIETTAIDGRKWRTFNAHITVDKIPFAYQLYVYTGPEGTFQLLGWTFENLFDRQSPQIREVLQSFKFPPFKRDATTAIPAAEESPRSGANTDGERVFDLPTLAKNVRPAVVLIVGFDGSGQIAKTGSGFFVSRTGRIVTNWHVIDGITNVAAKTEGGAIYKVAGVLAYSINLDLAVLKAEAEDVPFLSIEKTETPEAGTKIAVIGSPLALEGTLSEGIVSAVRKGEDGTWIQMTAPVSPGSSGSPVLNQHGRVIGVATLNSAGRYQNLNFARSSYDLSILIAAIRRGASAQPFGRLPSWASREAVPPTQSLPNVNVRLVATVTASDSKGLNLRADHTAKSTIVATLHHGDQVSLEDEKFRNNEPPEPVVWQKVTTSSGTTGWIRADYISSGTDATQSGNDSPNVSPGSPAQLVRFRIISLPAGGLLQIRKGPGANYAVVGSYSFHENEPILAGDGYDQRHVNGDTTWRAVYSPDQRFVGWTEERYLEPDY